MKLIIGLGNYPEKYKNTRHNFGFMAIDQLAEKNYFSDWKLEKKFQAECSYGQINQEKIILCKPQTYMNLSGDSAQALANFYKISSDDIIILSDDLDQAFGKTKLKMNGSAGGQRGIKDVLKKIGTQEIARIKFGITNDFRKKYKTEDFVLSRFTKEEQEKIPEIIDEGLEKLESLI